MDFKSLSHEQIDEIITGKLVFDNAALSPILTAHLFIERVLDELISARLAHPKTLLGNRNMTFEFKVDLARALDALEERHVSAFKSLNSIRNKLSHDWDYSLSIPELNSLKINWTDIQNSALKTAKKSGAAEASRIAVIFLCWEALGLVKDTAG